MNNKELKSLVALLDDDDEEVCTCREKAENFRFGVILFGRGLGTNIQSKLIIVLKNWYIFCSLN